MCHSNKTWFLFWYSVNGNDVKIQIMYSTGVLCTKNNTKKNGELFLIYY
ncbi:hypothetical protein HMPREF0083_06180 [Aneurinibacillus aneurinilyticus ATCC 12856]|uniref:Uncharacterized protein n=1 Tax=Aneurinibacillus aneurinilyticus ATCC 12856 TaxID=649747 RepID=U1XVK7_ANEAE|nr:hypothetical protein HMPREF0083_06180 [Aneurinibacillus aneurinilyticus ATCC 12856]